MCILVREAEGVLRSFERGEGKVGMGAEIGVACSPAEEYKSHQTLKGGATGFPQSPERRALPTHSLRASGPQSSLRIHFQCFQPQWVLICYRACGKTIHLLFVVFRDPCQAKRVIPALAPAGLSYRAEHTASCLSALGMELWVSPAKQTDTVPKKLGPTPGSFGNFMTP